jgi:hypothetical protein
LIEDFGSMSATELISETRPNPAIDLKSRIPQHKQTNNDDFSSSDEEKTDQKRHGGCILSPSKQSRPIHNEDEAFDILDDNDEDEMNEIFRDFVPPTKGKGENKVRSALSKSIEYGRGESNGSGDLASSSVRKGIIIKPGQAIRVKPVGKNKKG